MTVQEKRHAIGNECRRYYECKGCPLYKHTNGIACYSNDIVTDKEAERNYRIMFDSDEEPTAQLENIVDDADTIIKIKSNRKIDNITIYFKEDK